MTLASIFRRQSAPNAGLHDACNTLRAARDYLWIVRVSSECGRNGKVLPRAKHDLEAYALLSLFLVDMEAELEAQQ